jgi:hypothetical protein
MNKISKKECVCSIAENKFTACQIKVSALRITNTVISQCNLFTALLNNLAQKKKFQ